MALARSLTAIPRNSGRAPGVPGAVRNGRSAHCVVARATRCGSDRPGVGARLVRVDAAYEPGEPTMNESAPNEPGPNEPAPRHPGLSRRAAIGAGAGVLGAGVLGVPALAGWRGQSSTGTQLRSEIPLPPPFQRPMVLPPVLTPSSRADGADLYQLRQYPVPVEVVPGYRTTAWTYGGTFPGPTIRSRAGRRTIVEHTNELPVPTVVHLHGGVTPPEDDGYPTDLILPDETWQGYGHGGDTTVRTRSYEYPLQQRGATLWYHDHRMDFTGPAVWRGLAGFHLVTDPEEERLDLPHGERELPLALM